MSKNRMLIVGCGAMVAVVVAAWFVVFGGDAPDAVDVARADAQLDEVLGATDVTGAAPFDGEVDGVWIIDDEIGEFDFETASGSFAGFRVDEELTVGSVVAVGRSGGVTGSLTIEAGQLVATEVVVDMNAIVSNDSRREGAIRRAVGASTNPTASFVLDRVILAVHLFYGSSRFEKEPAIGTCCWCMVSMLINCTRRFSNEDALA